MNELNHQAYNQRLKPWCLLKLLPDMQRLTPDATYKIIFDPPNS